MTEPVLLALQARPELQDFKHNALLVLALEMRFGISDIINEAITFLTDDSKDKKCDALYIDRETGVAVIAQGYFSDRPRDHAPLNKASDLNTAVSWAFGGEHASMGESLKQAAADLQDALRNEEISAVEVWYCHNCPQSEPVREELEKVAETAHARLKLYFSDQNIAVRSLEVGIEVLSDWYTNIESPILVGDEITLEVDGWFEEIGDDWASICTSVPAKWLTELYEKYEDRLFSANVRGYLPSRKTALNINHNMERTAREKPARFWAYNNGVTALVHDYRPPAKAGVPNQTLTLTGIAIVNGAQTTGALSRAAVNDLSDAAVLVRFVRCSNQDVVDEIIRFNNSQNPIQASDFRSNDIHQRRLRDQFSTVPDATYFGARRGGSEDRARRPSNLLPSDTVAQALASFHGDPGTAYHDLRGIWERDDIYAKYFSDFTTAEHIVFVYSLLQVLQSEKSRLSNLAKSEGDVNRLTRDDQDILEYFRRRGSIFLLEAAIGGCMETFLGRPVLNTFDLSFGAEVSPLVGQEHWRPIVEACLPFVSQLLDAAESGGLRRKPLVEECLGRFRSSVLSTRRVNAQTFDVFAALVASKAGV